VPTFSKISGELIGGTNLGTDFVESAQKTISKMLNSPLKLIKTMLYMALVNIPIKLVETSPLCSAVIPISLKRK
jgi:hypothetical protein